MLAFQCSKLHQKNLTLLSNIIFTSQPTLCTLHGTNFKNNSLNIYKCPTRLFQIYMPFYSFSFNFCLLILSEHGCCCYSISLKLRADAITTLSMKVLKYKHYVTTVCGLLCVLWLFKTLLEHIFKQVMMCVGHVTELFIEHGHKWDFWQVFWRENSCVDTREWTYGDMHEC